MPPYGASTTGSLGLHSVSCRASFRTNGRKIRFPSSSARRTARAPVITSDPVEK
jgi:hypothetical protein